MSNVAELVETGWQWHRQGKWQQAEGCYHQALELEPRQPRALWLLGLLTHDMGHPDRAIDLLSRAAQAAPERAEVHAALGAALAAQGDWQQAAARYERAIDLRGDYATALNDLGNIRRQQGNHDLAVTCYERALAADPRLSDSHNNLGVVRFERGDLDRAIASYRRAVEFTPGFVAAHSNLGNALLQQGKLAEALAAYQQALSLHEASPLIHYHLGLAHGRLGNLAESQAAYERAVQLDPACAPAHNDLGALWQDRGDFGRAETCYLAAVAAAPDFAEAHYNLGTLALQQYQWPAAEDHFREALRCQTEHAAARFNLALALQRQDRLSEALEVYEAILSVEPDHAEAHCGRGMIWLTQGNLSEGWPELDWRWRTPNYSQRCHQTPQWDGTLLSGRTILVHADEALGDTLQFVRYLPWIAARGGRLVVEVAPALVRFLSQSGLPGRFVARGEPLPAHEVRIPLMSLPGFFGTTLGTIPHEVPYLLPDTRLMQTWGQRLSGVSGWKVGINWQGRPEASLDALRSIPLQEFAPLDIPGVTLISLQKRVGLEQLAAARARFDVLMLDGDIDEQAGCFMDTAAIMKHLDLVITSDTATAHLAGALGVPVWVALPHAAEWRWMRQREDSPWYPTMRLFRQTKAKSWREPFIEIASRLDKLSRR